MTAEEQKEAKKTLIPLVQSRFKEADYVRRTWRIRPEEHVTAEDVLRPEFYANVAGSLRPYDKIEVLSDDGTFYAELIVITSGRLAARVELLFYKELQSCDPVVETPDYKVEWKGGAKWCIQRLSDKNRIKDGCESKEEAERWLRSHMTAMAA